MKRVPAQLGILFAVGFIAYAYNNVLMTLTPQFVLTLGGDAVQSGLQGAVYLAVAVLLRFVIGPLSDAYGPKPFMVVGLVAFAVSGVALAFCDSFEQVLAVRALQAIGMAAFFPCATSTISLVAPTDRVGMCLGLYRFVASASLLVGPSCAYALAEASGYRACFVALGACSVMALVCTAFLPRFAMRRTASNAAAGTSAGCERMDGRAAAASLVFGRRSKRRGAVGMALGVTFFAAMGYGLLMSFALSYIVSLRTGMSAGLYFTFIGVGGLVVNPLAGWAADKASGRLSLFAWLLCFALGLGFLGLLGADAVFLAASGVLVGLGYNGAVTTILAIISSTVEPSRRSTALSLQQNCIDLGIALASGVFGFIFGVTPAHGLIFAGWGAVVAAAAIAVLASHGFRKKQGVLAK